MDGTIYYQINQCQWISSTENITGHNILEAGKQCLPKTVPKLKKEEEKSGFITVTKIYKKKKPKNSKKNQGKSK